MNRQEALDWCVENVSVWSDSKKSNKHPQGFYWIGANGSNLLVSKGAPDMAVITKQHWLDAKAEKESEMKDLVLESVKAFPVWPESGWGMIRSEDRVIALCLESYDEEECDFCKGEFYQAGTKCDIDLWKIACTREQHIRKRVELFEDVEVERLYDSEGAVIPRPTPEELEYIAEIDGKDKEEIKVNVDWSKAPEGATHFHKGCSSYHYGYYMEGRINLFFYNGKNWVNTGTKIEHIEGLIQRPTEPQWQNGLPTAGDLKSLFWVSKVDKYGTPWNHDGPNNTYIDAENSIKLIKAFNKDDNLIVTEQRFYPLKTQAEIERDKVVSILMCDVAHMIVGLTHKQTKENAKVIANMLIDKGFIHAPTT